MTEPSKPGQAEFEIQQNLNAATQLAAIKQNTTGGKTFKFRLLDNAMKPTLLPGDQIEVGGINHMHLKTNDLVYFRHANGEFRVRRLARRTNDSAGVDFIVADGTQKEDRITQAQILGVVLTAERGDTILQFRKVSGGSEDVGALMEKGIGWLQQAANRISGLFNRKSGG